MEQNKTGKYLKYAIGEIVLVVIGILIALQINNLNEIRKTDAFEIKLLEELYVATQKNIFQISLNIEREYRYKNSCELLLNYFEQELEYHDSLDVHFSNAVNWRTLYLDDSAYETTKSYGLHVLKNDSLRMLLTNIFEIKQLWIHNVANRQYDYHFNTITPILIDLFETSTNLNTTLTPIDFEAVKHNMAFINILKSNAINRDKAIDYFKDMLRSKQELEQMIKANIDVSSLVQKQNGVYNF